MLYLVYIPSLKIATWPSILDKQVLQNNNAILRSHSYTTESNMAVHLGQTGVKKIIKPYSGHIPILQKATWPSIFDKQVLEINNAILRSHSYTTDSNKADHLLQTGGKKLIKPYSGHIPILQIATWPSILDQQVLEIEKGLLRSHSYTPDSNMADHLRQKGVRN